MSRSRIPKALFDEVSEGSLEITLSGSKIVAKKHVGNSVITRTNDKSYFSGDDGDVKTVRKGCYEKRI